MRREIFFRGRHLCLTRCRGSRRSFLSAGHMDTGHHSDIAQRRTHRGNLEDTLPERQKSLLAAQTSQRLQPNTAVTDADQLFLLYLQ